jgi:hypothetical protein
MLMTKNLVARITTKSLEPEERTELLLKTYSIKPRELEEIKPRENGKKRDGLKDYYINLAALIFKKTRDKGKTKEYALAQITQGNLALAINYKDELELNERVVGGEISRCFREDKLKEEKRLREQGCKAKLNNMHIIRKLAYKKATRKTLEANVEETLKAWGKGINFSRNDLLFGTNIPPKITSTIAFVLGVYHAKGSLDRYSLNLSGEGDNIRTIGEDEGFFEKVLSPITKTLFKINGHTNFERGRIHIESEAHSSWLRKIGYGRKYFPNWKKIPAKNRQRKESDLRLYDRAFFLGMLAGTARTATDTAAYPFTVYDSEKAGQFASLANKLGYQVNYDKRRKRAYINREGVEKIMKERFEIKANGLEFERTGGFYNPAHIKFLCEKYIHQFYLCDKSPYYNNKK